VMSKVPGSLSRRKYNELLDRKQIFKISPDTSGNVVVYIMKSGLTRIMY